jgi:hypothetical protein
MFRLRAARLVSPCMNAGVLRRDLINDYQKGEAMGIEANKAIVRRYVELYNTGHVQLWSNQDTLGWL